MLEETAQPENDTTFQEVLNRILTTPTTTTTTTTCSNFCSHASASAVTMLKTEVLAAGHQEREL